MISAAAHTGSMTAKPATPAAISVATASTANRPAALIKPAPLPAYRADSGTPAAPAGSRRAPTATSARRAGTTVHRSARRPSAVIPDPSFLLTIGPPGPSTRCDGYPIGTAPNCRSPGLPLSSMALRVHRAERTDLLADGLGALLATPQPDPFAEELVVVPARGGTLAQSAAVACAGPRQRRRRRLRGVAFRSPASLIAEITGTRDDDPWSPMRWCGRCSPSSTRCTSTRPGAEPWPPTSATSPRGGGGVAPGSPIRGGPPAGRAVRLLRPAASATAGRLARRRSRRTRRRPAMAAAAVAGAGRQDGHRPSARAARQNRCPTAGVRCRAGLQGCRCSVIPDSPVPTSSSSRRWASTTTCTCGCPIPARSCGRRWPVSTARSRAARTRVIAASAIPAGHPRARPARVAAQPARHGRHRRVPRRRRPARHPAGLAAIRYRCECPSPAGSHAAGR